MDNNKAGSACCASSSNNNASESETDAREEMAFLRSTTTSSEFLEEVSACTSSNDSVLRRSNNSTKGGHHDTPTRSSHALKPQARRSNDLSSFTIDKLNYRALGNTLYGRDKELKILREKLDSMLLSSLESESTITEASTCTNGHRQLVIIKGYSGVGKSALACSLQRHPSIQHNKQGKGIFIRGNSIYSHETNPIPAFQLLVQNFVVLCYS